MKIATQAQHKQHRERLAELVQDALTPVEMDEFSKPYRNKSYSLIGWTGPKVKGVLVRRRNRA